MTIDDSIFLSASVELFEEIFEDLKIGQSRFHSKFFRFFSTNSMEILFVWKFIDFRREFQLYKEKKQSKHFSQAENVRKGIFQCYVTYLLT